MKLKEYYFDLVNDLDNTSQELAICSHWTKEGFSEKDFCEWLNTVSRFLKFMSRHDLSDLIKKES